MFSALGTKQDSWLVKVGETMPKTWAERLSGQCPLQCTESCMQQRQEGSCARALNQSLKISKTNSWLCTCIHTGVGRADYTSPSLQTTSEIVVLWLFSWVRGNTLQTGWSKWSNQPCCETMSILQHYPLAHGAVGKGACPLPREVPSLQQWRKTSSQSQKKKAYLVLTSSQGI